MKKLTQNEKREHIRRMVRHPALITALVKAFEEAFLVDEEYLRSEDEAWKGGEKGRGVGKMRISGDRLAIDWGSGQYSTTWYTRIEIIEETPNKEEREHRLAFFDAHYQPKDAARSRPRDEAWKGGEKGRGVGKMRVEGNKLVIRWDTGSRHEDRYVPADDDASTPLGEENRRRFAYFEARRPLAANEWRKEGGTIAKLESNQVLGKDDTVFTLRWHEGEKQYQRGEQAQWCEHKYFVNPEANLRANAWFEANRPHPEDEALFCGIEEHKKGMSGKMRVEGEALVIDWEDGVRVRLSREDLLKFKCIYPEQGAHRLAFFDKYRKLASNEWRKSDGIIIELVDNQVLGAGDKVFTLRWHEGKQQCEMDGTHFLYRLNFFADPETGARANAWFEANKPLRKDQLRIDGEVVTMRPELVGIKLPGQNWYPSTERNNFKYGTEAWDQCARLFAESLLARCGGEEDKEP